jgi:hypothetical protein
MDVIGVLQVFLDYATVFYKWYQLQGHVLCRFYGTASDWNQSFFRKYCFDETEYFASVVR